MISIFFIGSRKKNVYFYISIWCCDFMHAIVRFVKSISPDRINTCLLFNLDSSVAEHLTSHAGVPGSNILSSHTFSPVFLSIVDMCISLYKHASIHPIPSTDFNSCTDIDNV